MAYSNLSDLLTNLNVKLAAHTISKHKARLDKTFPPTSPFVAYSIRRAWDQGVSPLSQSLPLSPTVLN